MLAGKTVGVVVPAYNEERFVGEVIRTVPGYVDRVYAVDDASTDETWREIQTAAERLNARPTVEDLEADGGVAFGRRVVPIRHRENRGVGGAIKTGYLRARADEVDVVAVMGGDGQMDPAHLRRLLAPVLEGRADYAKGNRFVRAGDRAGMPRYRLVGNVVLTFLTRLASGYWTVGDPQHGYTAISLSALRTVDVENMYEFYGYCNDLLVKLNVAGLRVVDVPVPTEYGEAGSHISLSTYVPRVSAMLLRNFLWRLKRSYLDREFHPLVLLYATGALGVLGGLLGVARGRHRDAPSGGLLAVLVGVVAFALGMVFDRDANADLDDRLRE